MARDIEYGDAMTNMLELIWGVGFMTPGGEGNIAIMTEGLDFRNRRVLDIGCGIGGSRSSWPVSTERGSWAPTSSPS